MRDTPPAPVLSHPSAPYGHVATLAAAARIIWFCRLAVLPGAPPACRALARLILARRWATLDALTAEAATWP